MVRRAVGCSANQSVHFSNRAASPNLKDVPMQTHTLRVIVLITAKPDQVDAMRRVLVGLIGPSRTEHGCLSYELLHNTSDPTNFAVVEEWESEQHYAGHFEVEHVK